jgi:CTP:molybdopterin cytidylyltransferase MocA
MMQDRPNQLTFDLAARGVTAIVLAAGDGTRMGGPKALLVYDGVPLALAHARRAVALGCHEVVIALRRAHPAIAGDRVRVIVSNASDQAGSLRIALLGLSPGALVMITPVDSLPVEPATFAALRTALERGAAAVSPTCGGRGGHPVLCRSHALATFRTLRDVPRVRVEVSDPRVLVDLDTPADVEALTGEPPRFLP